MKEAKAKLRRRDIAVFKWVAAVMVTLFIGAIVFVTRPPPAGRQPGEPDRQRALGDFRMTDSTGREVTRADLQNKLLVVNFVFTSCSVSCAQVNRQMAKVQRLVNSNDAVRLVSFTVDPGTDTPPVLAQFGAKFGADTNRWLMLTGDKQRIYDLIEDSFLKRDPTQVTSPMPGGFIGTDRIVVVDRAGRIRRYFDGFNPGTPAAIEQFLNQLPSNLSSAKSR